MAYRETASIARDNNHNMKFIATVKLPSYSVDKYLCECGAEIQIASTSRIGVWLFNVAEKPCKKHIA